MLTKKYYKLIRVSYADSDVFRVTNISDQVGTLTVGTPGSSLECSTDGVTWFSYTEPITVAAGGNCYMKANGGVSSINMDVNHSIGGNIVSLVDKTNYASMTTLGDYVLSATFQNDTHLIDASNANFGNITTTGSNTLSNMFNGCTALVEPIDMSSFEDITSLSNTFYGCTSLAHTPIFTNLRTIGTFYRTFYNCTSLTEGVDITEVTSVDRRGLELSYYGCSALSTVYAPKISSSDEVFRNWLGGVAATGTIYCPSQTVADLIPDNSASGCPSGWQKVVM